MGKLAKDEISPATNLRLLLNSVSGPQEFEFPEGKRINPIEAIFSLERSPNKYPFDRYQTDLSLLMTASGAAQHPLGSSSPAAAEVAPQSGVWS